jgi:simple sugar transport system permease protein
LYQTSLGYELRLVGKNEHFARYGGVATRRVIVFSIMISGALAGLAGIVEILGIHHTYKDNFSAGLGFDGIIIALLARNHTIGVLITALLYAYLQVGAQTMQVGSDMPREVAVIIQVMLVLLVSSQAIFAYIKRRSLSAHKAVN